MIPGSIFFSFLSDPNKAGILVCLSDFANFQTKFTRLLTNQEEFQHGWASVLSLET